MLALKGQFWNAKIYCYKCGMIIAFQRVEKCFFRSSFVRALIESVEAFMAGIWMAHFHVVDKRAIRKSEIRSGSHEVGMHSGLIKKRPPSFLDFLHTKPLRYRSNR